MREIRRQVHGMLIATTSSTNPLLFLSFFSLSSVFKYPVKWGT